MAAFLNEFKHESGQLIKSITSILWHMRSITREEAWTLCVQERKAIEKMIEDRIEIVEKTGLALM